MNYMKNVHGTVFWSGSLRGKNSYVGDLDIYGRLLQKLILRKSCKDVDWIKLAVDSGELL
jgi:hypothetical protein